MNKDTDQLTLRERLEKQAKSLDRGLELAQDRIAMTAEVIAALDELENLRRSQGDSGFYQGLYACAEAAVPTDWRVAGESAIETLSRKLHIWLGWAHNFRLAAVSVLDVYPVSLRGRDTSNGEDLRDAALLGCRAWRIVQDQLSGLAQPGEDHAATALRLLNNYRSLLAERDLARATAEQAIANRDELQNQLDAERTPAPSRVVDELRSRVAAFRSGNALLREQLNNTRAELAGLPRLRESLNEARAAVVAAQQEIERLRREQSAQLADAVTTEDLRNLLEAVRQERDNANDDCCNLYQALRPHNLAGETYEATLTRLLVELEPLRGKVESAEAARDHAAILRNSAEASRNKLWDLLAPHSPDGESFADTLKRLLAELEQHRACDAQVLEAAKVAGVDLNFNGKTEVPVVDGDKVVSLLHRLAAVQALDPHRS